MRSKFKWIFTLLLAFAMQASFAQEKTITGTISDEAGLPMPGVNVIVKGTTTGTSTDLDGKYSIRANQGQVLEFTFVGMKTITATVGASSTINAKLVSETLETVEIVTEGYGRTRTKATTMGAINTISSETLANRPNVSFLNSLQGTAPGLTVLSSSGSPGSGKIDMQIRGLSSINAATDPLVVIDGVPGSSTQFRNLNQNDIESVSVLKDAAATSIYGNRGANGVLLVTTKRAKAGSPLKITYDGSTGVNTLPRNYYNMANSTEALTLERNLNTGVGGGITNPDGSAGAGLPLTDAEIATLAKTNTDWKKVFFGTDVFTQHNLALSIGGENISSYTSLGYYEQGGLVPQTDFKRFTIRNNMNGNSANKKFTYSTQIALGYSKRNELGQETSDAINTNTIQNPLQGSILGLPYVLPNQFANGQDLFNAIGTNFNGANDTYVLEDLLKDGSQPSYANEQTVAVNVSASYKITKDVTLSNKSGVDYKNIDRLLARAPGNYLAIAVADSQASPYGGFERINNSRDFAFTNIASLNYSHLFANDHNIEAGIYMEYSKYHLRAQSQTRNGLDPKTYSPGSGTGYVAFDPAFITSTLPTASASKVDAGTLSYFATFDYSYKDRYGVGGAIRRDATYRFVDDNKWGTFYSVSARWNIDRESFMEGSGFNLLKLRGSYGTQGNQNVLAAAYGSNPIFLATNLVRDTNATGGSYNNSGSGLYTGNLANPKAQWEEVTSADIGLDWRILDNRFEGTLDFYNKRTDKLYNVIYLSAVTGAYTQNGNNGAMNNKGVELALKYNFFRKGDFKLSVFANGSYNKNEVKEFINQGAFTQSLLLTPGHMAYEWNLIPYAGVNQANGNMLFLDHNGNLTETPDPSVDRRASGKSFLPVYQGGFGLNADYKGFFLDALFSYAVDNWRYDNQLAWSYTNSFIGDDNVSADMLQAWTPEKHTNFPSLTATNATADGDSDRYLKDSSFLRLKNASIGYNVPKKFLERTFISSLKFYIMGENLLTWTKWKGFDPESYTATYTTGYPNPKTVSFGTSVQF